MPYSQDAHTSLVASLLSTLSLARMYLDIFLATLYPQMEMPAVDLYGKLVIVTGANSGIGLEAARALAGMGAHVVLACRNEARGEEARSSIIKSTGNSNVEVELLDCGRFASVRAFLERWKKRETKRVDILINNAGASTNTVAFTEDGFEQTYQANHLSHVLLTHSLLNLGFIAPDARIISISSIVSYRSDPLNKQNVGGSDVLAKFDNQPGAHHQLSLSETNQLYWRSKASQAIWSMALRRRISQTETWKGITVQACHPGMVKTQMWFQPAGIGSMKGFDVDLFKWIVRMFGISSEQGAVTPVWLAVAPQPTSPDMQGLFWDRMQWKWPKPWCLSIGLQDELWDLWCSETDASLRY